MTEYDFEQIQKEREAQVRWMLTGEKLAERDRSLGFEVEWKAAMWEEWHKLRAEREASGWELADYGQQGSMFHLSGYFRRMKAERGIHSAPQSAAEDFHSL